jgi:hypothetical protein
MRWFWRVNGDIVGYDLTTRRAVARLQPSRADEQFLRPQEFGAMHRDGPRMLASSTAVYQFDGRRRSVQSRFRLPAGETILAADEAIHGDLAQHVVVASQRQILDRGRDGGVSATPPSEPDRRISRIRLSSQWFLSETNHKHMSRVPD